MRAEIDKIISLSERDSTDELQNFFSSFTNEQVTSATLTVPERKLIMQWLVCNTPISLIYLLAQNVDYPRCPQL